MACSIWGFYLFSFFNLLPISQVSPLQHTKRSPRRVPLLEEELRGQRAVGALTGQQGDRKKKPTAEPLAGESGKVTLASLMES